MGITAEYLQAEIQSLEAELQKAQVFQIQAQATISAYRMLLQRLEAPQDEAQNADLPETS